MLSHSLQWHQFWTLFSQVIRVIFHLEVSQHFADKIAVASETDPTEIIANLKAEQTQKFGNNHLPALRLDSYSFEH